MAGVKQWLLSFGEGVVSRPLMILWGIDKSQSLGNRHGFGQGPRTDLLHEIMTMRLDRSFRRPQDMGDLLVELTVNKQSQNLEFTRGQACNPSSGRRESGQTRRAAK